MWRHSLKIRALQVHWKQYRETIHVHIPKAKHIRILYRNISKMKNLLSYIFSPISYLFRVAMPKWRTRFLAREKYKSKVIWRPCSKTWYLYSLSSIHRDLIYVLVETEKLNLYGQRRYFRYLEDLLRKLSWKLDLMSRFNLNFKFLLVSYFCIFLIIAAVFCVPFLSIYCHFRCIERYLLRSFSNSGLAFQPEPRLTRGQTYEALYSSSSIFSHRRDETPLRNNKIFEPKCPASGIVCSQVREPSLSLRPRRLRKSGLFALERRPQPPGDSLLAQPSALKISQRYES